MINKNPSVAAAGLPLPRSDHAVVIAKFAFDCMARMEILTKELDVIYGYVIFACVPCGAIVG